MTRPVTATVWVIAVVTTSTVTGAAQADLPVAPPPREVRPDGTRAPLPAPDTGPDEDPLHIVRRIIANSHAVGDKLARTETGTDTQRTQQAILRDIDKLLDRKDPPPPDPSSDSSDKPDPNNGGDPKTDPKDGPGNRPPEGPKPDAADQPEPRGGTKPPDSAAGPPGNGPTPGKDRGSGTGKGNPTPQATDDGEDRDQPRPRRPRTGHEQGRRPDAPEPPRPSGDPTPVGGQPRPQGQPAQGAQPRDPLGGRTPDPRPLAKSPPARSLLPAEADLLREVWGHLPDKLRQQATQYYQQEFLPRYAELLKQYYSTLSEKK